MGVSAQNGNGHDGDVALMQMPFQPERELCGRRGCVNKVALVGSAPLCVSCQIDFAHSLEYKRWQLCLAAGDKQRAEQALIDWLIRIEAEESI
jgi:hypothetical protein